MTGGEFRSGIEREFHGGGRWGFLFGGSPSGGGGFGRGTSGHDREAFDEFLGGCWLRGFANAEVIGNVLANFLRKSLLMAGQRGGEQGKIPHAGRSHE